MDKLSYALGLGIGQQLKQMGLNASLVIEDFAASIIDVLQDKDLKISNQEAQVRKERSSWLKTPRRKASL